MFNYSFKLPSQHLCAQCVSNKFMKTSDVSGEKMTSVFFVEQLTTNKSVRMRPLVEISLEKAMFV